MTTIQDVNIRQVLSHLVPGENYGWNPPSGTDINPDYGQTMEVVTWRGTGDKPTAAQVITEWDAHSERYEVAELSYEANGDNYDLTVTLKHNIDGVSSVTLTVNGEDLPEATTLDANHSGTETLSIGTTTTVGIKEDYPHEPITIEV